MAPPQGCEGKKKSVGARTPLDSGLDAKTLGRAADAGKGSATKPPQAAIRNADRLQSGRDSSATRSLVAP
ncbi:hypothetical protein KILIM_088_00180, partial [Kineosphaera limosa NBRC 100340]